LGWEEKWAFQSLKYGSASNLNKNSFHVLMQHVSMNYLCYCFWMRWHNRCYNHFYTCILCLFNRFLLGRELAKIIVLSDGAKAYDKRIFFLFGDHMCLIYDMKFALICFAGCYFAVLSVRLESLLCWIYLLPINIEPRGNLFLRNFISIWPYF